MTVFIWEVLKISFISFTATNSEHEALFWESESTLKCLVISSVGTFLTFSFIHSFIHSLIPSRIKCIAVGWITNSVWVSKHLAPKVWQDGPHCYHYSHVRRSYYVPQTSLGLSLQASHLFSQLDKSKRVNILLLIYQMSKWRPSQNLNSDCGGFSLLNPYSVLSPWCQAASLKTKTVAHSFISPKDWDFYLFYLLPLIIFLKISQYVMMVWEVNMIIRQHQNEVNYCLDD